MKEWFIGTLAGKLVTLYCQCLNFEVIDKAGALKSGEQDPKIFTFWHNRILALGAGVRNIAPDLKLACLTSASRDGAMIENFMRQYGIESIRGSSSRRGKRAMIEMVKAVRNGYCLCITPDGPRGPVYELNPGALRLAGKSGAALVPVTVEHSNFKAIPKTWDKFRIPLPFSRVIFVFHEPISVPSTQSAEQEEEMRQRVEQILLSPVNYTTDSSYEEYRW